MQHRNRFVVSIAGISHSLYSTVLSSTGYLVLQTSSAAPVEGVLVPTVGVTTAMAVRR